MARRILTDDELALTWTEFELLPTAEDLRVIYTVRDTPMYAVGLMLTDGKPEIKFIVSTLNLPIDLSSDKTNAVELSSTRTIPLQLFNVAASLVSRIDAVMAEDRPMVNLIPNNREIEAHIGLVIKEEEDAL